MSLSKEVGVSDRGLLSDLSNMAEGGRKKGESSVKKTMFHHTLVYSGVGGLEDRESMRLWFYSLKIHKKSS